MEEITMSELWQTPSGDTTTPLSDIKDLDDLNSFYEDYDEVMFDQSISLFNFHDNFLINDYFLSMDTGFSSLNQTDDSCDNLTSLSFKQEPVSDFSFLFEDHTQNYITNTNITSFLNVDPGLRSKQKNIYNKKMNNLNTDYGDMISSTFSKPDFITDINDENVMFSDCSPCDTSTSSECSSDCASSGSNSYISEREATDEDNKKDMVVLGVDLSSLMHDYAARSPARETTCVLLKESQPLSSNTSIPQFSNLRSSEVKVQSSKYTPASFSVTKLENSDFYTAIRKNKTTPWKPNLIICRKTDNKLPQGAGHRMTSTGNDPMLSTYQIQDQPLSSSPPPISLKLDNLRAISNPSSSPSSTTTPSRTPGHDEKIHPCTYKDCQKVYNKSSHLKAHMRRHTGEKPFHCSWPDCEWKFSRSDELARHKRSHSGVKPYKCDFCLKCFSRSDHLSKHQKVHRKNN